MRIGFYIVMISLSNGIEPNSSLGLIVIALGLVFTTLTIFVFLNVNSDSKMDKDRKTFLAAKQAKKIQKLYPKKINNLD